MITLYGASGHGKVVKDVLNKNNIDVTFIIDDNKDITTFEGLEVNDCSQLEPKSQVIIAIGDNSVRKAIALKISNTFLKCTMHPSATIGNQVQIGEGSVVMANATINPSVSIGKHCIINSNAVVEHDCKISNYVHISPGAVITGGVTLGEGVHIGAGAVVLPTVSVGNWTTIGAGAVVTKDIPDGKVYVGNPAKFLRENNE